MSSRGATNFSAPEWRGFDFRGALEARLGLPVVYNNDGNAAALYAHHALFGAERRRAQSSVSAIVGTGLGGGVVEAGQVVKGAAGMAGELGHVQIPMDGLLEDGQPLPAVQLRPARRRRERRLADGHREEPAALLADPLPRPRAAPRRPIGQAAKLVRAYAERRRPDGAEHLRAAGRWRWAGCSPSRRTSPTRRLLPRRRRGRDGAALPRLVPDAVREHTVLREEQRRSPTFALVPDLDMAGARGSAVAARNWLLRG